MPPNRLDAREGSRVGLRALSLLLAFGWVCSAAPDRPTGTPRPESTSADAAPSSGSALPSSPFARRFAATAEEPALPGPGRTLGSDDSVVDGHRLGPWKRPAGVPGEAVPVSADLPRLAILLTASHRTRGPPLLAA